MAVLPIKILNIAWCTAIQNNYLKLPLKVKNYFFIEFLHESVRSTAQYTNEKKNLDKNIILEEKFIIKTISFGQWMSLAMRARRKALRRVRLKCVLKT